MTLNEMKIGSTAVIRQVGGEGPLRCRLLDMGLIPGTKVTLQKVAPMGDPIEIRVRGYEMCIRDRFPPCIASTHTALVLKEPKTKTSIRRVYLPKTVA